jgi:hypothetical protein
VQRRARSVRRRTERTSLGDGVYEYRGYYWTE